MGWGQHFISKDSSHSEEPSQGQISVRDYNGEHKTVAILLERSQFHLKRGIFTNQISSEFRHKNCEGRSHLSRIIEASDIIAPGIISLKEIDTSFDRTGCQIRANFAINSDRHCRLNTYSPDNRTQHY